MSGCARLPNFPAGDYYRIQLTEGEEIETWMQTG